MQRSRRNKVAEVSVILVRRIGKNDIDTLALGASLRPSVDCPIHALSARLHGSYKRRRYSNQIMAAPAFLIQIWISGRAVTRPVIFRGFYLRIFFFSSLLPTHCHFVSPMCYTSKCPFCCEIDATLHFRSLPSRCTSSVERWRKRVEDNENVFRLIKARDDFETSKTDTKI